MVAARQAPPVVLRQRPGRTGPLAEAASANGLCCAPVFVAAVQCQRGIRSGGVIGKRQSTKFSLLLKATFFAPGDGVDKKG